MDSLVAWLGGEAKTVAFAILSGVVGFLGKIGYDLWLARRKDKLQRLNDQLKLLYGPLYALNQAGGLAWKAFRSRVRPGGKSFFRDPPPPTSEELAQWRIWMLTVFRPMQEEMLTLITKNADLLIEDDLPKSLKDFCAHVAAYKVVFERWSHKDYSEHTSVMDYPTEELALYLGQSFKRLKAEQGRLLGATGTHRQRLRGRKGTELLALV
jgi:hypothetical protein